MTRIGQRDRTSNNTNKELGSDVRPEVALGTISVIRVIRVKNAAQLEAVDFSQNELAPSSRPRRSVPPESGNRIGPASCGLALPPSRIISPDPGRRVHALAHVHRLR
jgi:hypothetical protein